MLKNIGKTVLILQFNLNRIGCKITDPHGPANRGLAITGDWIPAPLWFSMSQQLVVFRGIVRRIILSAATLCFFDLPQHCQKSMLGRES